MEKLFLESLKKSKEELCAEAKYNYYNPYTGNEDSNVKQSGNQTSISGYWADVATIPANLTFLFICEFCLGIRTVEYYYVCNCYSFVACLDCKLKSQKSMASVSKRCDVNSKDLNMHFFSVKYRYDKVHCVTCKTGLCETIYRCVDEEHGGDKNYIGRENNKDDKDNKDYAGRKDDKDDKNCIGYKDDKDDKDDKNCIGYKDDKENKKYKNSIGRDCGFAICELYYQTSINDFIFLFENNNNKNKNNNNKNNKNNKNNNFKIGVGNRDDNRNDGKADDGNDGKNNDGNKTYKTYDNDEIYKASDDDKNCGDDKAGDDDRKYCMNYNNHKLKMLPAKRSKEEMIKLYDYRMNDEDYSNLVKAARKYFKNSRNYRVIVDFNNDAISASVRLFYTPSTYNPLGAEILRKWVLNFIERRIKPLLPENGVIVEYDKIEEEIFLSDNANELNEFVDIARAIVEEINNENLMGEMKIDFNPIDGGIFIFCLPK